MLFIITDPNAALLYAPVQASTASSTYARPDLSIPMISTSEIRIPMISSTPVQSPPVVVTTLRIPGGATLMPRAPGKFDTQNVKM